MLDYKYGSMIEMLNTQAQAGKYVSSQNPSQHVCHGVTKYNGQPWLPMVGKFKDMPFFIKKDICIRLGLTRLINTPLESNKEWYLFFSDLFLKCERHGLLTELLAEVERLSPEYPHSPTLQYDDDGKPLEKKESLTATERSRIYRAMIKSDPEMYEDYKKKMIQYQNNYEERKANGQTTKRQAKNSVDSDLP